jgi:hypothetical protein
MANYPTVFGPRDVFQVLYKDACYHACKEGLFVDGTSSSLLLPSGFIILIEDAFSARFETLDSSTAATSVALHRQLLLQCKPDSLGLSSQEVCLVCLRRRPQYDLACGHCICENCVRVFGRRSEHDPWTFEVDSCFWCGRPTSGVVVKTLPPTAGIRVLTFDGGGVRGLVTLISLQSLQDRIGLEYPVQEHFDVVVGTSSGTVLSESRLPR